MNMIMHRLLFLGLLASSPMASHAGAQEPGRPERGLALAQRICSECHAILKSQERSPNPAAPRFEAIANTRGMTAIALLAALQTPHREMPNIMLDAYELSDVIAYILSLKRDN